MSRRSFCRCVRGRELLFGERIEVGDALHEAAIEELLDDGFAEAFDVHDLAGGEVEQALDEARGAVGVDAAVVDFAFGLDDFAAADGAVRGELEFPVAAGMILVFDDFDDFGDDVAAALDLDVVADEQAEALDFVGVVEGGAADGGSSDEDRGEHGDGGELAGASDLNLDVFDFGDAGAGGEFVGDGPAGGFAGVSEAALDLGGIDLDDDAVDFVTEIGTFFFGAIDEGHHLVDVLDGLAVRVDAEAGGGERVEGFGLFVEEIVAGFGEREVGVEVETAAGNDVGLEGADGSGGGIARIDGGRQSLGFALLIHLEKGRERHYDFAADFEVWGQPGCLSLVCEIESGTERMVRTFPVTSSPMVPSPRVMPRARCDAPLPSLP